MSVTDAVTLVYYVAGPPQEPAPLVKIGIATDLPNRMRGLQFMSPVPLILLAVEPGYMEEERERHRQFAAYRRHGEWFLYGTPIQNHVASLNAAQPVELKTLAELGRRALDCFGGNDGVSRSIWQTAERRYRDAARRDERRRTAAERNALRRFFAPRIPGAAHWLRLYSEDGLIEEYQLRRALGTSVSKIRQAAAVGLIHQRPNERGTWGPLYTVEEILSLSTAESVAPGEDD